jgi:hypothetical protein
MRKWFTVIKQNLQKEWLRQKRSLVNAIHKIQICICQSLDPCFGPTVYLKKQRYRGMDKISIQRTLVWASLWFARQSKLATTDL